ncbi:hypothetical protein [Phormidium pseudopriestleyi]|nr:hypothetical protein [Phormidium pseudopriestleyi]
MSKKYLLDTNILIYYLNCVLEVKPILIEGLSIFNPFDLGDRLI